VESWRNVNEALTRGWKKTGIGSLPIILPGRKDKSRSQWSCRLRHEQSSLARTLGSWWVRIPLEAWMSVCLCAVLCAGSNLATGWSPVQGVLLIG
jgi:hypothetical protein